MKNIKNIKWRAGRLALFFAFLALTVPLASFSAAWLQEKGKFQFINSAFFYTTKSYYDFDGNRTKQDRFNKLEYIPYIEYGLRNDVTIGTSSSLQYLEKTGEFADSNFGFGDVEFFLRKELWKDDFSVFSIQPLVKFSGLYDKNDSLRLGQGQIDLEIRGLYGHSFMFMGENYFSNFELAYRKRTKSPEDELRFDATVGLKLNDDIMFLLQSFNLLSFGQKKSNLIEFTNSANSNSAKLQFSTVKNIGNDLSLQLGVFKNILQENSGGGGGLLFSIWKKF